MKNIIKGDNHPFKEKLAKSQEFTITITTAN